MLPALPLDGFDADNSTEEVRYRSLKVASQLALLGLYAAGHRPGAGEYRNTNENRVKRIRRELSHSPFGSPSRVCSEYGEGGGGRSSDPTPKRVSLPRISILEVYP